MKDRPSYTKLKSHLISLYCPKAKQIFNIHDPIMLRYLFQLRLGLSKLRYHKKRHGFNDTATDKCLCNNGIEDTHHYLLVCPFYTNHRVVLKSEFEKILHDNDVIEFNFSVDLFLYGHSSLECSDNMKLLAFTLKYIRNTNRLTTWQVSAPSKRAFLLFTFLFFLYVCLVLEFFTYFPNFPFCNYLYML